MREDVTYTGYKRVNVPMQFIDNGQGAGYLRLVFPDGTYYKIFPVDFEALYEAMQQYLNTHDADQPTTAGGGA